MFDTQNLPVGGGSVWYSGWLLPTYIQYNTVHKGRKEKTGVAGRKYVYV